MQMKFGPAMPSYENWCTAASFQMRSNKTQTEARPDCAAAKTLKNQQGVESIFACRTFVVSGMSYTMKFHQTKNCFVQR